MVSFGSIGIGLSSVFGFIFLGIVAEIYHLVKNRNNIRRGRKEISDMFCCKNLNSVQTTNSVKNPADPRSGPEVPDLEVGPKAFCEEESVELELKRLHNLHGPPRFLFTIKEETKEDLESDHDVKSRKGSRTSKSLGELVFAIDTPINSLTPLASPKGNYRMESNNYGLNPLFGSISEVEMERVRASPPPKMKFLRDAEEKLMRRLREEEAEKRAVEEQKNGSFIRIIVGKSRETEQHQ